MRFITGAVAWVYDFLAEDTILLFGAVLALLVAYFAVKTVPNAAGIILFVVVLLVISISLWRTISASR